MNQIDKREHCYIDISRGKQKKKLKTLQTKKSTFYHIPVNVGENIFTTDM
jgi:hypothetical protein